MRPHSQVNMCLARSIVKSLTIKLCEHSELGSIFRMAIHRFVDHQLEDAISKYINHHSVKRKEEKNYKYISIALNFKIKFETIHLASVFQINFNNESSMKK